MFSLKTISFSILLLCLVDWGHSAIKNDKFADLEFFHLGTVNGKGYYSENTTDMAWFESKALCSERNMTLATITTLEEYEFITSIADYVHFYGIFWTGARDAQDFRQYSWDNTGEQIGNFMRWDRTGRPPLTCLAIVGARNYWLTDRPCIEPSLTLCEKME